MIQSVVDIPKIINHNKYNFNQLIDLPADKALRIELPGKTEASTARGVAWNFCKRHKLNLRTHTTRENGDYALYAWLI